MWLAESAQPRRLHLVQGPYEQLAGAAAIATSGDVFEADGTTIRAVTIDGDTKGGFIGSTLRFTCINATQWYVEGLLIGTGTMATPFATS